MFSLKVISSLSVLAALSTARADLDALGIFNGRVGLSLDGVGSNNHPAGNVQAHIPDGATVLAAYLYSAGTPFPWYPNHGDPASPTTLGDYNSSGISLGGNAVTFNALVGATSDRPELGLWRTGRADVTDIVKSLRVGGQENYNWSIAEGLLNERIDGEVLAVVYEHASLPEGSVVLLDGGQATGGESTSVLFTTPLGDTTQPGFSAEMSLGISFSTGHPQSSQIDVNGIRLSSAAGGFDDGGSFDGGLLTVGGIGDSSANPANPFLASSLDDELYSLKPFLTEGDTGFTIATRSISNDDNIFFMGLRISAQVEQVNDLPSSAPRLVNTPDSGTTASLLCLGLTALSSLARRKQRC